MSTRSHHQEVMYMHDFIEHTNLTNSADSESAIGMPKTIVLRSEPPEGNAVKPDPRILPVVRWERGFVYVEQ